MAGSVTQKAKRSSQSKSLKCTSLKVAHQIRSMSRSMLIIFWQGCALWICPPWSDFQQAVYRHIRREGTPLKWPELCQKCARVQHVFLATPTHLHSLLAAFPLFAYIKFKLKCWLFDTLQERTLRALQRVPVPGYKIGLPGRNVIITLALKCTRDARGGHLEGKIIQIYTSW